MGFVDVKHIAYCMLFIQGYQLYVMYYCPLYSLLFVTNFLSRVPFLVLFLYYWSHSKNITCHRLQNKASNFINHGTLSGY